MHQAKAVAWAEKKAALEEKRRIDSAKAKAKAEAEAEANAKAAAWAKAKVSDIAHAKATH